MGSDPSILFSSEVVWLALLGLVSTTVLLIGVIWRKGSELGGTVHTDVEAGTRRAWRSFTSAMDAIHAFRKRRLEQKIERQLLLHRLRAVKTLGHLERRSQKPKPPESSRDAA